MTTAEFLNLLKEQQDKSLLFEYSNNHLVGANYHITEVKNTTYDTVDCGGGTNFWKETIVQLWESPTEIGKRDYMTVYKALSILKKVNRIKPMDESTEIKFEYGNKKFHTSQLFVNDYEISEKKLIIKLAVEKTDCKAKEICCAPENDNPEVKVCCEENSGCC
ncbi:DUF6428 family protein [Abyssalbus ytuae]|uniref:DUF6428 family protein n=1 Tax=Abyssalbus ytuae TaxID=2926907 RepID=A0A9E6ZL08_9FLAO|nr:DUF6428 family protein [Abyssalbus ytuae]UOB16175.1 DUF6428 family protein [Abyssalbus ytuae]